MSQSTSTAADTLTHDLAQGMLSAMGQTSRAIQETREAIEENMAHMYLELYRAVAANPNSCHIAEHFAPIARWMEELANPGIN